MEATTSASAEAARRAWRAAFTYTGEPTMPPDIALDHVQDVTGDRDDAFLALMRAAGDYLEAMIPPIGDSLNTRLLHDEAMLAVSYVRGFSWGLVRAHLMAVCDYAGHIARWRGDFPDDVAVARAFIRWVGYADDVMTVAKRLEEV